MVFCWAHQAQLYFGLIHQSLSEAARRELRDMLPTNYEYQSDFARKYYGQGKTEGLAEGSRKTQIRLIGKQLVLRFGPLDQATLSRIDAAPDAELDQIAERLLTAATLDEALGGAGKRYSSGTTPDGTIRSRYIPDSESPGG